MNINRALLVCWLATLITLGYASTAQQIAPPSNPPCSAATAKICPIVNWPQFHFDSAHTGFNPYEKILSPATVGNLVLDWKAQTLMGVERISSSPAVVSGKVYFGGDGYGNVYALDVATGTHGWRWDNNGNQIGSPAVAYGKVYVADSDRQRIQVLDAGNGHLVGHWGFDIPADVTLADGAIYVATGHMGYAHYTNVYALDANTGDLIWNRLMQDGWQNSSAVANHTVYATCTTSRVANAYTSLCAIDAATGTILWQFASANSARFFPDAVSNAVVYAGGTELLGNRQSTLNDIYAVDAATGKQLWQRELPDTLGGGTHNIVQTTPAVANGIVYVGFADGNDDSYGYLYGIDAQTGTILWRYKALGGIHSSAAVANGVVYFGCDDKNIYALNATTGALLWNYTTGNAVVSSPAVVNGMLFVGSEDTYMYAFHLPGQ